MVMDESDEAGDLLQALKPSFPAEATTVTFIATADATARLVVVLFGPPNDMLATMGLLGYFFFFIGHKVDARHDAAQRSRPIRAKDFDSNKIGFFGNAKVRAGRRRADMTTVSSSILAVFPRNGAVPTPDGPTSELVVAKVDAGIEHVYRHTLA
jgi:hypothetical protein